MGHFCQTLFLTKSVFLSPLSRWPQGQEGAPSGSSLGLLISQETQAMNHRGPQAAKEHWGSSCQGRTEQQGQLSHRPRPQHPLPCASPALSRRGPCTGWHPSSQPSLSHHFTNLLLEEKSSSIVILELDENMRLSKQNSNPSVYRSPFRSKVSSTSYPMLRK